MGPDDVVLSRIVSFVNSLKDNEEKNKLKERKNILENQKRDLSKVIKRLNDFSFRKQTIAFATQGKNSLGVTGKM
mgnify:CR=1 FL=1